MVQKYEADIQRLKQTIDELHTRTDEDREVLARRFEDDKEIMEEEIARAIRQELEVRFIEYHALYFPASFQSKMWDFF